MNIVRTATRLQDQDDLSATFTTTGQVPAYNSVTGKFDPTVILAGATGPAGPTGPAGAAGQSVTAVTVTGLAAGASPTSTYNTGTGALALGIPAGATGATGAAGAAGLSLINSATDLSAPATITGQVLSYNSVTSKFDPATVSASVGIGSTLTGSPTTGAVLIVGTSGVLAQDTKLAFDATNKRLGVGIAVPTAAVHAVSSATTDVTFKATGIASQSVDIWQAKTSAGAGPIVTSAGVMSCPGAGTLSEIFGAGSSSAGANNTFLGANNNPPNSTVTANVYLGRHSNNAAAASVARTVSIGDAHWPRQSNMIAIGATNANASGGVLIGDSILSDGPYSIVLGYLASVAGAYNNTFVVGANASQVSYINAMYLGGTVDASPKPIVTYNVGGGTGTDIGGSDAAFAGGNSTGMGSNINPRGGAVRLKTSPRALTTGTGANGPVDRFVLAPEKSVTTAVAANLLSLPLAAGANASLKVDWTVEVKDGTDQQRLTGVTTIDLINKAGTLTSQITAIGTPVLLANSGTLTFSFAASLASSVAKVTGTATTSLTPSTGYPQIWLTVGSGSRAAITLL